MTTYANWKSAVSGNWATAADWSSNTIPDANVGVSLPTFATAYVVTVSQAEGAYGLVVYARATLNISAGVFSDHSYFVNAGTVNVQSGAEFDIGFAGSNQGYGNSGKIALFGGAIKILDHWLGFNNGGQIVLSNNSRNLITGGTSTAAATLDNVKQTIVGAGAISGQYLHFINSAKGVVNAADSLSLTINIGFETDNEGLIESTGAGGLSIKGNVNNEGELRASAGLLRVTGNVDGNGYLDIAKKGGIELGGYAYQDVNFETGSTGTLVMDHGSVSTVNEIYGAAKGVHFDLRDVLDNSTTKPSFSISGSLNEYSLTVTDGSHSVNLYLAGGLNTYNHNSFMLGADGKGGTLVTVL